MTYKPDQEWGFLNKDAQATTLPAVYAELEHTACNMGDLLQSRQFRSVADNLQAVDVPADLSKPQYGRLWTIYSMLASAYVFSVFEGENAKSLPKPLALPLYQLSKVLDMPPIMNYEAYIHNNFRAVESDAGKKVAPEHFEPLFTFSAPTQVEHEGEKWFVAVQVASEKVIAPAVAQLADAQKALRDGDDAPVLQTLQAISSGMRDMAAITARLPERLNPKLYSRTPLQYVFSFKGLVFDGVDGLKGEPQHFRGESGGQSVVPRALAAFLGIEHGSADMAALGQYMEPSHRLFVELIKSGPSVKSVLETRPALTDAYNDALAAIKEFRVAHMRQAALFVGKEAFAPGPSGSHYLADNLRETREAAHRPAQQPGATGATASEEYPPPR